MLHIAFIFKVQNRKNKEENGSKTMGKVNIEPRESLTKDDGGSKYCTTLSHFIPHVFLFIGWLGILSGMYNMRKMQGMLDFV